MTEFPHGSEQHFSARAEAKDRTDLSDLLETIRGLREIGEMLLAGKTADQIIAHYGGIDSLREYVGDEALNKIEQAL